MLRRQVLYALGYLAVVLWVYPLPADAATTRVAIIYSESSPAQKTVAEEIDKVLKSRMAEGIEVTTLTTGNAGGAAANGKVHDLIVTVGVNAAMAYREAQSGSAILHSLVPTETLDPILADRQNRSIFGIQLDQPIRRQIGLLKAALPYHRNVAVLLGPSSINQLGALRQAAQQHQVNLHVERVADPSELIIALEKLLKHSQVLLAIPDPVTYNRFTVQKILLTTYRHQVPVVAFSAALVRAGATLAVHSSPEQIGRHVAEEAIRIITQSNLRPAVSQAPRYYSVSVNHQVARSLGLSIPSEQELLKTLGNLEK